MIMKIGETLVGLVMGTMLLIILAFGSILELWELPRYLRIRRM